MPAVRVTMADNGGSVEIGTGDILVVGLKENPTTGFRWEIDAIDEAVLAHAGSTFERPPNSAIGGGGVRHLEFRPLSSGECDVNLKLWRSWTGPSSVRERFSLRVRVKS